MLIPLGILASSGGAAGSYELIETVTLSSSQSSVTFSNLGDYSSTYQHLQLRIVSRSNRASAYDNLRIRLNGATGSVYSYHYLAGNGSSVFSGASSSQTGMLFFRATEGGNATANTFGYGIFDILDPYETSKYTTIRALEAYNHSAENAISLSSGLYQATTAVSSIELAPFDGANFVQYSRFSLYGLRGTI